MARGPEGLQSAGGADGLRFGAPSQHTHTRTHAEVMSRTVRHPGAVLHVPCQGREMICESWGSSQLMCTELCVPVQPG